MCEGKALISLYAFGSDGMAVIQIRVYRHVRKPPQIGNLNFQRDQVKKRMIA